MLRDQSIFGSSQGERRRFRRVRLDLPGRLFIPADARETRCRITNISAGDAAVSCAIVPELGTELVLYVDGLGRFQGHVVRHYDQGFSVSFDCTQAKRERTAEQLIIFLNKPLVDESLLRRRESCAQKEFATITRADGSILHCEVMAVSSNGVSLKTGVKPHLGEYVLIAEIAGRVTQHHSAGIALEFIGQQKPVS